MFIHHFGECAEGITDLMLPSMTEKMDGAQFVNATISQTMMWTTRASAAARTALYSNKGRFGRISDDNVTRLYHRCCVCNLVKRRRQFSTTSSTPSSSSSKTPPPICDGRPARRTRRKKKKAFSSKSSQSKTLLSRLRSHTATSSQRQRDISLSDVADTAELMNKRLTTRLQWLQDTLKESWKNLRLGSNNNLGDAGTKTPGGRQRQVELSHEFVMDANWWFWNLLLAATPAMMIATYCQFIVKPRMVEANEKASIARKSNNNSTINDNEVMSGIGLRRLQQQREQWQQDGDHHNQESDKAIDASTVVYAGQDQRQAVPNKIALTDHLEEIWTYLTGTRLFGDVLPQQQQQQHHPQDSSSVVSDRSYDSKKVETRRLSQYRDDNQTEMLREQLKALQLQLRSLELQLDRHAEHRKDRTKTQVAAHNTISTTNTLHSKEKKEMTVERDQEVQEATPEDHCDNAVLDRTHPSSSSWQESMKRFIGSLWRPIDNAVRKSDSPCTDVNRSNTVKAAVEAAVEEGEVAKPTRQQDE